MMTGNNDDSGLLHKPSILIDRQIFNLQRSGGISRYFSELGRALADREDWEVIWDLGRTANRHVVEAEISPGLLLAGSSATGDWVRRLRKVASRRITAEWRQAVAIHHTFYDPAILALTPGAVRISTIHDMTPEIYPEWFPTGNPHRGKQQYVAASHAVVCVSDATRTRLLDLWGPLRQPSHVIPLGVSPRFSEPAPSFSATEPYLLFVGSRAGYKDFTTLLAAVAALPQRFAKTKILCVGGGRFTRAELAAQEQLGLRGRVRQREVTDTELVGLYRGAAAFVFPSRSEGFGLPTLEALASGTPVVLSDIAVFREVADTAGVYFRPGDVAELSDVLSRVLTQSHNPLAALGAQRAADFTWAATARATAAAYDDALAYARSYG